jgi:hypothetical protein
MIRTEVKPTIYSFEAAKSLTSAAASDLVDKTQGIWRFEYKNDIVTSLPPDATVDLSWLGIPSYSHVGRLAFIEKGKAPAFLPANAVDPVSDAAKLGIFPGVSQRLNWKSCFLRPIYRTPYLEY